MNRAIRRELPGCLSFLLCLLVLAICGVWLFFGSVWPQALVGGMLATAILLKD